MILLISLICLVLLISYFRINAFLSFLLVAIGAGLAMDLPHLAQTLEKGIGNILGSLTLILVLGAMLGKLVAESGAADRIASYLLRVFGEKNLPWGLTATGFIVGIPLFYGVGFVLLVPLVFSIAYKYKFPPVYLGLPMLAALSVTHGFIPPHPSPVALVSLFGAEMHLTLLYGLAIALPAIILGGPLFSKTLKNIKGNPPPTFQATGTSAPPDLFSSLISTLFPVLALVAFSFVPDHPLGSPSLIMVFSLVLAAYFLGWRQGKTTAWIMGTFEAAVKDIAMILLIIAGSGMLKQVMEEGGIAENLAGNLVKLDVSPLLLGWWITAAIRACVGSATVAALTAGGVLLPLAQQAGVPAHFMVLSIGAGSLMFSHVNDTGFWLFKEYFGLSLKDTFRTWSVMEAIVSIAGLGGVLLLNAL
jgi:Gnt-I system high-affinity gluconate transporter